MKTINKIVLSLTTASLLATSSFATCGGNVAMGNHTISGLANPTNPTDAVNFDTLKKYSTGEGTVEAPAGYEVIYKGGMAWLDRNVGATQVAPSWNSKDADGNIVQASLGSLFQWGRAADGHQFRDILNGNNDADVTAEGDAITTECATSDNVGHNKFITGANASGDYNWRTTAADCNTDAKRTHLWSAPGDKTNGVCPAGWRVPTEQDFKALDIENGPDAYDKIKLNAAGYRSNSDGSIHAVGSRGYFWTSSVGGSRSRGLHVSSGGTYFYSYARSGGFPVRCVKHIVN